MKKLGALGLLIFLSAVTTAYAASETYQETFDAMQDGATVKGVDSWAVPVGDPKDAVVESGDTFTGSGKALKLIGTQEVVKAGRSASYGNISPTWIEYVVKPGLGAEQRSVPATGVAAVNFSSTGDIMVSDGTSWVKTGRTFNTGTWYRVIMKLDFSTHMYSVYSSPANTPKTPFSPDKENLHFIDPTVSAMSQFGFYGAHNAASETNSLVDEVIVHTIDKLQIVTLPQTIVKGYASETITVQIQDANSEPQTTWKDIELELQASTPTAQFSIDRTNWSPVTSVILPANAQQATFYFRDTQVGRPTIRVHEFPDHGWTSAVQEEKVVSEGEYFGITTTTPQVAGVPFDVTVTAKDSGGGIDMAYNGSVDVFVQYISPAVGTRLIQPDVLNEFALGLEKISMTYADAGTVKIAVRDKNDSSKVGFSGDIEFLPNSFSVDAAAAQVVGKAFPVTVKALSAGGETTPNYQGPAKIGVQAMLPSSSDGVLSISELAAGQFQNGEAKINTTYNRWGSINISAYDVTHPEKKGLSNEVKFHPKSISISVKKPSETRNFFYVSENMEVTVSLLGEDGLPVENYEGVVNLVPSPAFGFPSQYTFASADKGQKVFVVPAGKPDNYIIKVSDPEGKLSAESQKFEVKEATIIISSTAAPVGAASVEIQLVDAVGKRITAESEMKITVVFTEEVINGSTFFADAGKPISFKNGLAKIVLGDTEAETVTVSAKSLYGLKITNGKVMFGRPGAVGVGALMLREKKD